MANTTVTTQQPTNGVNFPGSFRIDDLTITTASNKTIDLRLLIQSLEIYEDIYSNNITAKLDIIDANDFIGKLPIVGGESVSIKFKSGLNDFIYTKTFIVSSITNRKLQSERTQLYSIDLITEEAMIDASMTISTSWKNTNITDIIKKLYQDNFNILVKTFENTSNNLDYIAPMVSPFRAINMVSNLAISSRFYGSTFFNFETSDGYYFYPLSYFFTQDPSFRYYYTPSVVKSPGLGEVDSGTTINQRNYYIQKYFFPQHTDFVTNINEGMYANHLITHNIITKEIKEYDFNYDNYFDKTVHTDTTKLNFNKTYSDPTAKIKLYPKSSYNNEYDNQVENWLQNRLSFMQSLQNITCKFIAMGNSNLKLGDMIEFNLPAPSMTVNNSKKYDKYYRGNYMITAIRHIITREKYITSFEGIKDSLYSSITQGSI